MPLPQQPNLKNLLRFENQLKGRGFSVLAGLDEVGRGCLAGPVAAAALILPADCSGWEGINDSKKLSPLQREKAYAFIQEKAVAWAVGFVSPEEIDRINILNASKKAMLLALEQLPFQPQHLLIDGNFTIASELPQTPIIGGDGLSLSIAAASIMAKVTRDRYMATLDEKYPGFSFARHKGYGTAVHLEEIKKNGLTDLHRRSFGPCNTM